MVFTVSTWELSVPGSNSLKVKRAALRSLKDRLGKMNVSVIESGLQDHRARAKLSVGFLAAHNAQADAILESLDQTMATARDAYVIRSSVERF